MAAVLIPIAMSQMAEYSGLLQRAMFVVAYVWLGSECLAGGGDAPDGQTRPEGEIQGPDGTSDSLPKLPEAGARKA
jgi:hypothetical protein